MKTLNLTVDYSTLCHELRTPLVGILGMSELLDAENLTAEQKQQLAVLHDAGDRLLAFVNQILNSPAKDTGHVLKFFKQQQVVALTCH